MEVSMHLAPFARPDRVVLDQAGPGFLVRIGNDPVGTFEATSRQIDSNKTWNLWDEL